MRAASMEDLLMPMGRSATNEEQQPLRAALSQLLSKSTIMQLHLPLMVSQFTETLQKCDRSRVPCLKTSSAS